MSEAGFAGRVALVTGGSRGIGAAVVRALAAAGADVVIASRDLARCSRLADDVATAYGVTALPFAFHSGEWADNDALAAAVLDRFGWVDVLVNNVGMSPLYGSIIDVTEALYDKVLDVNLRGPFRLTALLGTHMKERGAGVVVNVGSAGVHRPDPAALPYAAAKAGLHTLTEGFASLLGPEVRVNTVHPGPILTDIADHWPDGVREEHERTTLLRRCGTPDEVADAVLYLAGDRASYVTGTALRVDGGFR
jgi:NAD(P)-dependent dehydrogenase (short-subunit alcohol dehydrogenase family)